MSDDIHALLERTTPTEVAAVDYDDLPRRARRRRRAKRTGAGLATAGVAVIVAATMGLPGDGTRSLQVTQRPPDDPVHTVSADGELDPVGRWSDLATLPSGPRVEPFAGTLPDGRVLAYGGRDDGIDGGMSRTDGVLIDPETGEVTPIPDPPLPSQSYPFVDLAGDRLLVFGGPPGAAGGAVYDVSDQQWTPVPVPPVTDGMRAVAWNGEILITGHSQQGPPDEQTITPTESPPDPPEQPVVLQRWSFADADWESAAPTPLAGGFVDAVRYAFDGRRLALWIHAKSTDQQAGQAAIYDADNDQWTPIDAALLPDTTDAGLAWINDGLAVVPSSTPGADPVVITDSGTDTQPLAAMPHPIRTRQHHFVQAEAPYAKPTIAAGAALMAVAAPESNSGLPTVSALRHDGTWTPTIHARQLVTVGDTVVALSLSPFEFPNMVPLEAAVLTEHGWAPAPPTELDNRASAGIAVTADGLIIVGGWSVRAPQPREEPDVRPRESGAPDPYVLDIHDTVIRLDLPN